MTKLATPSSFQTVIGNYCSYVSSAPRHDTTQVILKERQSFNFLFFLALVVFFSSTSARNQKRKLEKRQVSRLPTNTKLKKSTHSPNAHLCKPKKEQITDLDFHSRDWRALLSATTQEAVQKQPGKMMIKCRPLQPRYLFFVEEGAYKQNARHIQHQD